MSFPRVRVTEPLRADNINMATEANAKGMLQTSSVVEGYASGAGVVSLLHDLGAVPDGMIVERVDNIDVYASRTQRTVAWAGSFCEVTATGAGNFRVWFFRRIA